MTTDPPDDATNRRLHRLEGAYNLRDLGGLPTEDGGETLTGRVFRSDSLQSVTIGDVARLRGPRPEIAVLDGVLGVGGAAEHPVGHGEQIAPVARPLLVRQLHVTRI